MAATSPITVDAVRARVAEILGEPAADLDGGDNLLDRGLDSIRLMSLVEWFRGQGVEVSFADLAEEPTMAAWALVIGG